MKKLKTLTSGKNFLIFFILFNILLMHKLFHSIIVKGFVDYQFIIGSWKVSQYFFTYFDEFSKRGLIGTVFDLFNIEVTYAHILLLSIIISNIFFVIFYIFSKAAFNDNEEKYFNVFMIFFIISPATIMHLGADLGRYDHYILLVFITSIVLLSKDTRVIAFILPILLVIGLLIHEIFLFLYAPVIIAIFFYLYKSNNKNIKILYFCIISIISTLILLYINGKVDIQIMNNVRNKAIMICSSSGSIDSSLLVWSRSVFDNIFYTLNKIITLKSLFHVISMSPLLILTVYILNKILKTSDNYNINLKLIFYSVFFMFPLYILGRDSARWTALLIMNLFIVFIFLKNELKINLRDIDFTKKDKIILVLIFLHTFLGPIEITTSYKIVTVFL